MIFLYRQKSSVFNVINNKSEIKTLTMKNVMFSLNRKGERIQEDSKFVTRTVNFDFISREENIKLTY